MTTPAPRTTMKGLLLRIEELEEEVARLRSSLSEHKAQSTAHRHTHYTNGSGFVNTQEAAQW